jgi:hypothetical protein
MERSGRFPFEISVIGIDERHFRVLPEKSGEFEESVRSENRTGTDQDEMGKTPVGQHGGQWKPGTLRTGFSFFRQFGKRTAEHDQIPVGKRLPHQGVMQLLKLLKGTAGSITKNTESAGIFHLASQLFLPEQLRGPRLVPFEAVDRTDFPDSVLKIFQMDPFEQPVPSEMEQNIAGRPERLE